MAIYKETYRGRAIYWHGEHGYGSETDAVAPTIRECRARIDALLAEDRPLVQCEHDGCIDRTARTDRRCDRHATT